MVVRRPTLGRDASEAERRAEHATVRRPTAITLGVVLFCAGLASGWLLGTLREPPLQQPVGATPAVPLERAAADARAPEPDAASAGDPAWDAILGLGFRVVSLEALLAAAESQAVDTEVLVGHAIARLDEDELRAVLGRAVHLDDEDLGEIDDLPGYTSRLARIAMQGVVAPVEPEDTDEPEIAPVDFARSIPADPADSIAESTFGTDVRTVYAIFPLERNAGRKVMVKWFRTDRPDLLMFRHYLADPGEAYGLVWKEAYEGWTPGDYQVDVYSGDEDLELLARGRYRIR